ncbi:MAG: N-acetylneuraminate synthase family protein [Patescibacteria group bacterium]
MNSNQIWEKLQNGVFIIAEIGKNFIQTEEERTTEEYLKNAKQLVDAVVKAGADAVKFQTHNVEDEQLNLKIIAPHFFGERHAWVTRNTKATPLNEFWKPLKAYCDERGIVFFSTPMSRGAAKALNEIGVNLWKIASGDVMDFPLLDYVRRSDKPIIISSGQSTFEEVEKAVNYLREKNSRVALLHCVSKYPCPVEELRLGTIKFLRNKFNIPVGFSDHSVGDISPDITAVAMGATILEKHFSFSRSLWGSDHKVSMTPEEMKSLVAAVQELERDPSKREAILNSDYGKRASEEQQKVMTEDEAKFRPVFRKSLMAGQDIPAGTIITAEMLYAMRPQQYAGGLPSEKYEEVIGKKVVKDLKKYDPITDTTLV